MENRLGKNTGNFLIGAVIGLVIVGLFKLIAATFVAVFNWIKNKLKF